MLSSRTHSDSPTPLLPAEGDGAGGFDLEKYRNYLSVLARVHLGHQLHGKIDASDIVQQTFLDAHRHVFRGTTENERLAWLRKILATNLAMVIRTFHLGKRDIQREHRIHDEIDASSARLEAWLAIDQSSPSCRMQKEERLLFLANALEQLPEAQREVVILKHCYGWRLAQICQHLSKSSSAVAGLLQRGTKQLREIMRPID